MVNLKFLGVGIAGISIVIIIISISYFQATEVDNNEILLDENEKIREIDFLGDSPIFRLFIYENDIGILPNGESYVLEVQAEFKPDLEEVYEEISVLNEKQNSVVVFPIFTSSAYSLYPTDISTREHGFYDYYEGLCFGPINTPWTK